MQQSVRRTVRLKLPSVPWQVAVYRDKSKRILRADFIQRFVGGQLSDTYIVRYTLNPKGHLLVQKETYAGGTEVLISVVRSEYARLPVCFLPDSRIGKRVSRKAWVKGGR